MRVFVSGASGFIGSAVVQELIENGHQVVGLARSDDSAKKLREAGAQVQLGSIEDLESLRSGVASADGAIHTAFYHDMAQMDPATRQKVLEGGSPDGIGFRFITAAVEADRRALETLGQALKGGDRPLVTAFPLLAMKAARVATEDDSYDPKSVGGIRGSSEDAMQALASLGVRTSVIRLPPAVHGAGDRGGLIPQLINIARTKRVSAYVADGRNRWAAVHRLDAARLFRLALEKGSAKAKYHAVGEEGLPFRQIAEIIGKRLGVPVVSKSMKDAAEQFSFLAPFVPVDNPASSKLTQERLGWTATQSGLIADLDTTRYFET